MAVVTLPRAQKPVASTSALVSWKYAGWPARTAVAITGGRWRRRVRSTTRTGVTRMRAIDDSKRSSARSPTKFASRLSQRLNAKVTLLVDAAVLMTGLSR